MGRIRQKILARVPGLSAARCRPLLRVSAGRAGVLAARRLAELGDWTPLVPLLASPVPALRMAAADGVQDLPALRAALETERCTSVAVALAAAAHREGGDLQDLQTLLQARVLVPLNTTAGVRTPEATLGLGLGEPAQDLALALASRAQALASLQARTSPGPEQWRAMEVLGAHRKPEDFARLHKALATAGKRGQNSLLLALGRHGDPRALPLLQDNLARMDVDPGRGFAWRRLSALAIGRIGDPSAVDTLRRALEVEALEHEGRPGAGLGIQFPVRAVLLWALGELQLPSTAPLLAGYLEHTWGSALGGFHLPAMGALYKLGAAARPVLEGVVASGSEQARDNAQAVLDALDREAELRA